MAKEQFLRAYLEHEQMHWRVYTFQLKDSGFYMMFSPGVIGFNTKSTYHPKDPTKLGSLVHTKRNDKNIASKDQPTMSSKSGWPDLLNIITVPIDSYGFETNNFSTNDPFLNELIKSKVDQPALTFPLPITPAFVMRIYLAKTEIIRDEHVLHKTIACYPPEELLAYKVHHFTPVTIAGNPYLFSCIVCLVGRPAL